MHDKVNKVYNDLDSASIEAIPADGIHRNVDIPLVQADKEGYVRVYLMAPGVIFGVPKGALVDLGIQQKKSIAISALFEASVDRKRAGYIGGGKNVWPAVSLRDVAALYLLAFDTARENPEALGHGRDGFYIAENCEWRPLEMMTAAGKILVEYGIADGAEPTPFSKEEEIKYFGTFAPLLASNCGARGDRSRTLGWTPVDGKEELLQSVREGLLLHLPQEKKQ
ncbi:hypothetical protein CC2G_007691 [Coprinopsis cinerea AmutBmut pab1-1]|nr:hypothetical protein CC2G_007691 [Coprinopsis cinerea AmutBmut pab1-1]